MTPLGLDAVSKEVAEQFEKINMKYIKLMSGHIGRIGKLKPEDLHRLEQMAIMNVNAKEITKEIAKQCKKTEAEIQKIMIQSGADQYEKMKIFYKARGIAQVPLLENKRMMDYLYSIAKRTNYTFENISKTTAVRKEYQKAVDRGIYAVTNGMEDYQTAVRTAVKEATANGTKVIYASGHRRRLDSAVRMNILDGVRQANQGIRMIAGEEFGADGVEISAHALCAEDHADIQGLQFSMEDFENLNNSLDRPIGELNCHHTIYPIVLGVSEPAFSQSELNDYADYSNEMIDYGDGQISRYQASQKMRQMETNIRYQREYKMAAEGYGDTALAIRCQDNIKRMENEYTELSASAGLAERKRRTKTVSASKAYKQAVMDEYPLEILKKLV